MASEDFVSYSLMRYLKKIGWDILQYHPPGGQANFALKVSGEIVYPDIIAYKQGYILTMENKSKFAISDINKLKKMISDDGCKKLLIGYTSDYLVKNQIQLQPHFDFLWGHGYSGKERLEVFSDVYTFIVNATGGISIIKPTQSKLEFDGI